MSHRVHAVVPAAGYGKRMGSEVPKQYLPLGQRSVLEHTLWRLATHPAIERIVVVVSAGDAYFLDLVARLPARIERVDGGTERYHSVMNGLQHLARQAAPDDWVMVHDAARPCVRHADLDRMIGELRDDSVGGILAAPVRDTLKRGDTGQRIDDTVDRRQLWHAMTPQMFRLGHLQAALAAAQAAGLLVTDEAQAVEAQGGRPRLVHGHSDNIKITLPEDLQLAALILQAQSAAGEHEP